MKSNSNEAGHDQILGIAAVAGLCDISKASIYRLMKDGRFPQAMPLISGGRRVGWRASEVMAWAEEPLAWGASAQF
jgi:predicted DNA-binding transcriptional regulator AlpA